MPCSRRKLLFGAFGRFGSRAAPGSSAGAAAVARVQQHCLTRAHMYCALCRDSCPEGVAAIRFEAGGRLLIDERACTGCGQCLARCPVTPPAIVIA